MSAHASLPATPGWATQLRERALLHFWIKTIGITAFTWLFFVGYFHLLRHPAYPVTLMPLTALDRWIAFEPLALFPYLTLWFYLGMAPATQPSFRHLLAYGAWSAALCLCGLALFYFWPTAVPPRLMDVSGYTGFALLQGVDAPGNACPSMHVAVGIFSAICLNDVFRQVGAPAALRWINALWFVAIAWSTVATRQHVVLDAAAGALLGAVFAIASLRWRPGSRGLPP